MEALVSVIVPMYLGKGQHMKLVSLILTTYNCQSNLAKTLESIEMQDYANMEIVLKDGCSTDGTLDIIRDYEKNSRFTVKWVSVCDKGIYDAMNQGYQMAAGDVIVFFNDEFMNSWGVSSIIRVMEENPECVGAHADLIYATDEKIIRYWKMGFQKSLYWGWMPGHPTLFLKREIYEKYGLYNPDYAIAADYEFMIRFLKDKDNRLAYLPEVIIRMYYGGTSTSNLGSYLLSLKEGHRALKDNGIKGIFWIDLLRISRVGMQFLGAYKCKKGIDMEIGRKDANSKMERIAIDLLWVRPGKVGGTESFIRNLLDGFMKLKEDFDFILLVSLDNAETFRHYEKDNRYHLLIANIESSNIAKRIIWQNLFQNRLLRKNGLKKCFEPVYCKPWLNGGVQYVCVIHDLQALHYPQYHPFHEVVYSKLCWRMDVINAAGILTISDWVKADIEKKYHRKDIEVIYNPILVKEDEVVDFDSLRKKYNIEEKQFFYTVSQMIPHKNLQTLISIMSRIVNGQNEEASQKNISDENGLQSLPDKLVISGVNGNAAEELKKQIQDMNLQDAIILTGFVSNEERNTLYQNCHTFLFPSVFEGFGMPPIEAMLFKTRVITTKCASIPEVTQGKAVYVDNPYDVGEWIEKIAEHQEQEAMDFSVYDPEKISKKYLAFLKETVWKKR